jgi:hypothetical protein
MNTRPLVNSLLIFGVLFLIGLALIPAARAQVGLPECPDPAAGVSIPDNCDASAQPISPDVENAQPVPANGSGLAGSAGAAAMGGNTIVLMLGGVLVVGTGLYLVNRKK